MNVTEITMFRGTRSVNGFDRIKNECAGESLGVTNMAERIYVEMIQTCREKNEDEIFVKK